MSDPCLQTVPVVFIGIDVSSRDCYAAIEGQKPRRFDLNERAAASLASWVRKRHPEARLRAVMEHTGVYSLAWTALLKKQGIECALCNPTKIRYQAMADGQRSKTDKADALAILSFALHYRPQPTVEAPHSQQQLALLDKQRSRIIKQRVALQNEITALSFLPDSLALVQVECQEIMDALEQAEASIEAKMALVIAQDAQLREADQIVQDVSGIGPATSVALCSILYKILDCNPKELTSLCGLAPAHRQSGTIHKPSHIDKKGCARIRQKCYMAALSASRCNAQCIAVRLRLEARGKPGKVIIIAVARHLLLQVQKALKSNLTSLQPAC